MGDMAVQTLASGGHGGGRIAILVLVLTVVAVVVAWLVYACRARRGHGQ